MKIKCARFEQCIKNYCMLHKADEKCVENFKMFQYNESNMNY